MNHIFFFCPEIFFVLFYFCFLFFLNNLCFNFLKNLNKNTKVFLHLKTLVFSKPKRESFIALYFILKKTKENIFFPSLFFSFLSEDFFLLGNFYTFLLQKKKNSFFSFFANQFFSSSSKRK
jgi:hypothetical protein